MRLINENVERDAEGSDIQKWMSKGYSELEEATEEPSSETEESSDTTDAAEKNTENSDITEEAEEPTQDLESLTVQELRTLAKEKGLEGTSSLNKQQLIDVLKEE